MGFGEVDWRVLASVLAFGGLRGQRSAADEKNGGGGRGFCRPDESRIAGMRWGCT